MKQKKLVTKRNGNKLNYLPPLLAKAKGGPVCAKVMHMIRIRKNVKLKIIF